jgi:hypothetical protein
MSALRRGEWFLVANCVALGGGMSAAWACSGGGVAPAVSYLLSRSHDPRGWTVAAYGLLASAVLLGIAAGRFQSRWACFLVRTGCFGLAAMAVLAVFTDSLGSRHDALSVFTLMALLCGSVAGLFGHRKRAKPVQWMLLWMVVVIALLIGAYLLPDFFDESTWWKNLALAEWMLIATLQVYFFAILRLDAN